MKSSAILRLATCLLLLTAPGALAEDAPPLKRGERVRMHAGTVREIPGVVAITPTSTEKKGEGLIIANDDRLVAVKVPAQEEPLCLPRPGQTLTGRLDDMDDQTWTITLDGRTTPFKVPRYAIARMDRSRPRSRWPAALIGAVATAGLSYLVICSGFKTCGAVPQGSEWGVVLVPAAIGGAVGFIASNGGERWESLQTPGSAGRRLQVRATIRF